jgi:translation initiation factor IF-2
MDTQPTPTKINLPEIISVKELAGALKLSVSKLISILLKEGILVTINDSVDFNTAAVIASDLGFEPELTETTHEGDDAEIVAGDYETVDRAPVITIMGHVDHGKTSLLDRIRESDVVSGESGGITQHIGAYQVEKNGRKITFLDTPGHEAFSAIRAQGAKVTDIVVLIVAADDGVKPQTVEAINLAKAAGVPIIVAITKVDKPEANVMKVRQELSQFDLAPEDWGGKTVFVEISNKTGQGVDDLLEMIILTADILELKARGNGPATGIIIESAHDSKQGVTATVLIQAGELKVGAPFVVGSIYGKVKFMENSYGVRVKEALPSQPVKVAGFSALPNVGDTVRTYNSEKEAKAVAASKVRQNTARKQVVGLKAEIKDLSTQIKQANMTEINLVVKADTFGSLEAILSQIAKIHSDKGQIKVVASGLGNINESDILTAAGGQAFVVSFKVGVALPAQRAASKEGVTIMSYEIIYELTDDLVKLLLDSIGSEHIERATGDGEVLALFRDDEKLKIIGMKLAHGKVKVGNLVSFTRDEEGEIGKGKVKSIKQLAESIAEVEAPGEFGFQIELDAKVKVGDKVEFIEVEEHKAEVSSDGQ